MKKTLALTKRCLTLLLVFLFTCNMLFAKTVPIERARQVAKNFYNQKSDIKYKDIVFSEEFSIKTGAEATYYIFNLVNDKGFVIISGEDRVYPVLGYSLTGNYSLSNQSPSLKNFMTGYEDQINYVKQKKSITSTTDIDNEWARYDKYSPKSSTKAAVVGPLITTRWSQGCYYNTSCPADAGGSCGHVVTGCVATAMAQVMKYHNHPANGTGSHSYSCDYGTLSVNYGTSTYNWGSMPNTLSAENTEVAKLMYHCGVSVDMDYGPSGSGAVTEYTINALETYFDYSTSSQFVYKSSYSDTDWGNLLKAELNSSRPMIYRGRNAAQGYGHAWVCDGYDDSPTTMFHFNWGWGGYEDGYFLLTDLSPASYTFNDDQGAGIGIRPAVPSTKISTTYCGRTNFTLYDGVYIRPDAVTGATMYEFAIYSDAGLTNLIATQRRQTQKLYLSSVSALDWGNTYYIKVRAYVGTSVGPYGSACSIGIIPEPSEVVPNTQLMGSECGKTNFALSGYVRAAYVEGATQYEFEVYSDIGLTNLVGSQLSGSRYLRFSNIPGMTGGNNYYIRVRAHIYVNVGTYGNVCRIGIVPSKKGGYTTDINDNAGEGGIFKLSAYPNPFTNDVTIELESDVNESVYLKITDMSGRVVAERQIQVNEPYQLGNDLSVGIYLLQAVNNEGQKTNFKLIKTAQ